jgi:hypothetical protein
MSRSTKQFQTSYYYLRHAEVVTGEAARGCFVSSSRSPVPAPKKALGSLAPACLAGPFDINAAAVMGSPTLHRESAPCLAPRTSVSLHPNELEQVDGCSVRNASARHLPFPLRGLQDAYLSIPEWPRCRRAARLSLLFSASGAAWRRCWTRQCS